MSRFGAVSEPLLEAVRSGCSIDEASGAVGVSVATVRRWLTNGRKGREPYVSFAVAVDAARDAQRVELDAEMTHAEAMRIVVAAMRRGSLQAVKLWLDQHPRDGLGATVDPLSEFIPEGFHG